MINKQGLEVVLSILNNLNIQIVCRLYSPGLKRKNAEEAQRRSILLLYGRNHAGSVHVLSSETPDLRPDGGIPLRRHPPQPGGRDPVAPLRATADTYYYRLVSPFFPDPDTPVSPGTTQ